MDEFDQLTQSVMFSEEDVEHLQTAGDILEPQINEILDLWYGFVGLDSCAVDDAGAVNQRIQSIVLLPVAIRELPHIPHERKVGVTEFDVEIGCLCGDSRHRSPTLLASTPDEYDGRATPDEFRRLASAIGAPSHECHFAGERVVWRRSRARINQ